MVRNFVDEVLLLLELKIFKSFILECPLAWSIFLFALNNVPEYTALEIQLRSVDYVFIAR